MLAVRSYLRTMNGGTAAFCKAASRRSWFATASSSAEVIRKESKYGAQCYHPLPVVLHKGRGVHLWDIEGKKYLDYLSGIGAVNQGHCHPKILEAMISQAKTLHHVSRSFHHSKIGVETGETALKFARRWAYTHKGIPDGTAKIVMCDSNFWGRTIAATSSSTDKHSRDRFGPFAPGFLHVPFNDVAALEACLESDPTICAFMVEPIQAEAGIIIPNEGYIAEVQRVCKKHNVLLIVDEVQTGIGRTGKDICCDWDNVKPDILLLAKGLGGGFYPVSAVLSSSEVMLGIQPGQHGSTFGGNPVACAVATAALNVLKDENLSKNALIMGERMREGLRSSKTPRIKEVRGRGLLNAIEIDCSDQKDSEAFLMDVCIRMRDAGLITKWTKRTSIRLQPPLIINEDQIDEGVAIISSVLKAS